MIHHIMYITFVFKIFIHTVYQPEGDQHLVKNVRDLYYLMNKVMGC